MRTQKKWLQLICWLGLYVFWVMVFQKREFAISRTATVEFCYLLFIAANFYFNIVYTVPQYLYKQRYILFAALMASGIVVTAALRVPLATYLNHNHFLIGQPQPTYATLFVNSLLNIFIWTVCLVAGKLVVDRFRFQQYVDTMAKEKERAELDFLNAQFNPHFLFNSINSIYAHIDKHNTTARSMLLVFSDMLRYQLYECNSNTISIEKETSYIKNYVALQAARKDERLIIDVAIADNVTGFEIAPLLFIAFIENAFKYVGSSDDVENKVGILLQREGDSFTFRCYNTKQAGFNNNNIEHKGIGIANARRRLALLYAGKHELDIKDSPDSYEVNLKLQLT